MAGDLNVTWVHGAANCASSIDPPLQVHRFNASTFILRQNKCSAPPGSFEGPFLYLLFGKTRTLLVDTGATASAVKFPVATIVNQLRQAHATAAGQPVKPLLIAHSHSHGDHTAGDGQFSGQPGVKIVPPSLAGVKQFYGLPLWPNGMGAIDLGNRIVDVIPTPGHEPSHVTFYDRAEQLLLTGDSLYPGLLVVNDWQAYRASIARLVSFAAGHPVALVLGAHVEMTNTPGRWFGLGTSFQPNEHVLQLGAPHLAELHSAIVAMGSTPRVDRRADFIVFLAGQPMPSLNP